MCLFVTSCVGGLPHSLEGDSGTHTVAAAPAVGLPPRVPNGTCRALPAPPTLARARPAYPALSAFAEPVALVQPAGGASHYVVERRGRVLRFDADAAASTATVALDLTDVVDARGDGGLVSAAFHPAFARTGALYLSFATMDEGAPVGRIARYTSRDGGRTFTTATRLLDIPQPDASRIHLNADLKFGPDGMLYVGVGDGGPQGDPHNHAQSLDVLDGKILRLDVDRGEPYAIPRDNPFAGTGRPEIFALGLRNPWRFSFDRGTGALWVGDVGGGEAEEIDRVEPGANLGWPSFEGTRCVRGPVCNDAGLTRPVAEYAHGAEGASVVGGYVYRGRAFPELVGRYVFADYVSGDVWALTAAGDRELVARTGKRIVSFAERPDGELLLVDFGAGLILALERDTPDAAMVPELLSQTGCFGAYDPNTPAPALIPFDVAVSAWADGATKRRFLALPNGKSLHVKDDGSLTFPVGVVLVKEFFVGGRKVETRLLMKYRDPDWAAYTYAWDRDGRDARLAALDGQERRGWSYPSRAACFGCHNGGGPLALHASQLDHDVVYEGTSRPVNQLAALQDIGALSRTQDGPKGWQPLAAEGDVETRARTYLHVNCASCHTRQGPTPVDMDLRRDAPLGDMNVCDVRSQTDALGLPHVRRLVPGQPDASEIVLRMRAVGEAHMPPIGPVKVDEAGVALVAAWIASLGGCPPVPER